MIEPFIIALAILTAVINLLLHWHHSREIKRLTRALARKEAELDNAAELVSRYATEAADLHYQVADIRLAAAVRRYGHNIEYAYIGLDDNAADYGHDFIYRN